MMNNEAGSEALGLAAGELRMREKNKSISNTKARFSLSLDPTATCEKVC